MFSKLPSGDNYFRTVSYPMRNNVTWVRIELAKRDQIDNSKNNALVFSATLPTFIQYTVWTEELLVGSPRSFSVPRSLGWGLGSTPHYSLLTHY